METWPEFVKVEDRQSCLSGQAGSPVLHNNLTGWETVIFELEEDQDAALSTAVAYTG